MNAFDVCQRFNEHAKEAFLAKYKDALTTQDLERILHKFGPLIRTLHFTSDTCRFGHYRNSQKFIDYHHSLHEYLQTISKYTGATLKHLKLSRGLQLDSTRGGFEYLRLPDWNFHSTFEKLESLEIVRFNALPKVCPELKVLRICKTSHISTYLDCQFPKLAEVQLVRNCELDDTHLERFLQENPTIEKLVIGFNRLQSMKVISLIGQHLSNLVSGILP